MYFVISYYQPTEYNPNFGNAHFCIFGKSHTKVYDSRTPHNTISRYEVSNYAYQSLRSAKCKLQSVIRNNQRENKYEYWNIKSYIVYTKEDGKITRRILAKDGNILVEDEITVVQASHEFIKCKDLSSKHLANRDPNCCSIFAILDTNHVLNLCLKLLDDIQPTSYADSGCIYVEKLEEGV